MWSPNDLFFITVQQEQQLGVVGSKYGFANKKSGVFFRLKVRE
jgi:hypothetical protein